MPNAVPAGAGHEVQMTGERFNETLLSLWRGVQPATPGRIPLCTRGM